MPDHYDHADHKHHGSGHTHAPASFGTAFALGIILNTAFVLIEAGYGIASNSVALIADAGHNLSDVLGLVVAWTAAVLATRPPSQRYTYGLRGSTILAALFNAAFLLIAVGAIGWESVLRLLNPEPVAGKTVMVVAAIGIAVNGFTAYLFASGRKSDLNIRGAYLHMAADAAVSLGVVIAGLVILLTGWLWLDPVVSLAIVAVIVAGTWGLLRDSLAMSLGAVPREIEPGRVLAFLMKQAGVAGVHDLHIWPMSTTETALTAHLVTPSGHPGDSFILGIAEELRRHYGIGHATLQVETDAKACPLAPEHVV
jgi:cobalt-zinc-cadmium efflux system protein